MHGLNEIDYGIIGIISISVLVGLLRGFVRDSMALITWIVAGFLALKYYEDVAAWFTSISIVGVRLLLAFILIVLITLIVGGIVSHLLSKLIKSTKFSITDRIIGILFGLARGAVIISVGILMTVLIVKPSNLSKNQMWKASVLIPQFAPMVYWIKAQLPEGLVKFFEDPAKNSDAIKKTLEKVTGSQDSIKEVEKPIEKPLAKPFPDIEIDVGALEKSLENIEVEEMSSIEDFTENALAD
ncbi:MAG TPA: CvpA family protein [Gammaproteobacteria bacterium]|nr:CvpA family protein [Gammaproteobacteria bacterium]